MIDQWNRPPYPGGYGPNPFQQGAFPPGGFPAQLPPGYPAPILPGGGFHPPPPQFVSFLPTHPIL